MKTNKPNCLVIKILGVVVLLTFAACGGGSGGENESGTVLIEGVQFDRMGIAGINTIFIPSASKDAFNAGDPSLDSTDHGGTVVETTEALRNAVGSVDGFPAEDLGLSAETVRDIVIPDTVNLDLSTADGFPNGRRLEDDVIDTALQVTLNRSVVGDGVANDSAFLSVFPYLGEPNAG